MVCVLLISKSADRIYFWLQITGNYSHFVYPPGISSGFPLFLRYINDLAFMFEFILFLLYADNIKFFSSIRSLLDFLLFQKDLNSFVEYSKLNKLHLNFTKSQSITFTRNLNTFSFNYTLGDFTLCRESSVPDLGILYDSKMPFE